MRTTIFNLINHPEEIPPAMEPYLEWTPEQYVDHWSDVRLRGGHIPKQIDKYLILSMRHIMESHPRHTEVNVPYAALPDRQGGVNFAEQPKKHGL